MTLHTLRLYCPDVCLKNCFSSKICPLFTSHLSYLLDFYFNVRKKVCCLYFCFKSKEDKRARRRGWRIHTCSFSSYPSCIHSSFHPLFLFVFSLSLSFFLSFCTLHSALDTSATWQKRTCLFNQNFHFALIHLTGKFNQALGCCLWHFCWVNDSVKDKRKSFSFLFIFFFFYFYFSSLLYSLLAHFSPSVIRLINSCDTFEARTLGFSSFPLDTHIELGYCFHVKFQQLLWHFWWWKRGPVWCFFDGWHTPRTVWGV